MLKREDIDHLAMLARIDISAEEKEEMAGKLDAVLGYVSTISAVAAENDVDPSAGELRNVMRPDTDPRQGGLFTDTILANAPKTEDGYVRVAKII